MTLAQKVSQMSHRAPAIVSTEPPVLEYQDSDGFEESDGWWNEALHGVVEKDRAATVFPAPLAMGCTWNPELIQTMADAISTEARILHNQYGKKLNYFSPTINILRDPRWGRNDEGYSEDPYLMGQMSLAFCLGMQDAGNTNYLKTVTNHKHFVANNYESVRQTKFPKGNSIVPERWLREYYFPAYKTSVEEGPTFGIMSAYSGLNGDHCSASKFLLTDVLRTEWDFKGLVVSDCGATEDLIYEHGMDPEEAVALAAMAGLDLSCAEAQGSEQGLAYNTYLESAVQKGILGITPEDIDKAVIRLFTVRYLLGEFDDSTPYDNIPDSLLNSKKHHEISNTIAKEGTVLLKNKVLPLDKSALKNIVVLGPFAKENLYGGYYGMPDENNVITVYDGIKNKVGPETMVSHYNGYTEWENRKADDYQTAVKAANSADAAIIVISDEGAGEGSDLKKIEMPATYVKLLKNITNPNTVVLLISSHVPPVPSNVHSLLFLSYGGQGIGEALADVIFGDYNPGGKLSQTAYASTKQLFPMNDYDISKGRTYWFLKEEPQFPFGYGLSYTSFSYDNLNLTSTSLNAANFSEKLSVSIQVTNTGDRGGDEIVQLYVKSPTSDLIKPSKKLRAFKRINLEAGETKSVDFTLSRDDFTHWDTVSSSWKVEDGTFQIQLGASSADIKKTASIELSSSNTITYNISTNTIGQGSITINKSLSSFTAGTDITIVAIPEEGWKFDSWSGDLNGSNNPRKISVDTNKLLTAKFIEENK